MAKHFEDIEEVDVVSLTNEGDVGSTKNEDLDETENSSSFADTNSNDGENSLRSSDSEVESVLFDENGVACPSDPYDPFGPDVRKRKKKVTKHWRNFIRPLMSRLKWTEIRLKQLESLEMKYRRELLQEDEWAKHKTPEHFNLEESGSKSIPFSSHEYRSKTKRRRKRKKVEETSDIAAYASKHYLFSYLENKMSDDIDDPMDDDFGNPVMTKQQPSNSTKNSDVAFDSSDS